MSAVCEVWGKLIKKKMSPQEKKKSNYRGTGLFAPLRHLMVVSDIRYE